MPDYTQFNGVANYGDSLISTQLEVNVANFLQWGFVSVGAFKNVTIHTSGVYGGNFHQLRLSRDQRFTSGRVWEGVRSDWVWETGVPLQTQPIQISGIYVNGGFQPATGVGTYKHKVDYPNGRIIFDSPIPATSVVTCEYSHRHVRIAKAESDWFQSLQFNSYRVDDTQFLQAGSGAWDVLTQSRIQLPAIVMETVPRATMRPHELGNLSRWHTQDILFHVLAENHWDRKQLHDILVAQWNKTIRGVDVNVVAGSGKFPLNLDGSLASGATMYPQIVDDFYWRNIVFKNVRSEDQSTMRPLYMATVRATLEIILP